MVLAMAMAIVIIRVIFNVNDVFFIDALFCRPLEDLIFYFLEDFVFFYLDDAIF